MPDNKLDQSESNKPAGRPEQEEKDSAERRQALRWYSYGLEFVGVIALFSWLGHLADEKFQTSGPWWLLTGFFVAFVGMIYLLLKETGTIK